MEEHRNDLKPFLWAYIRREIVKKSWLLIALIIWFAIVFSIPFEEFTFSQRKNFLRSVALIPIAFCDLCAYFYHILKLIRDIVTGCETKTIVAYVTVESSLLAVHKKDGAFDRRYSEFTLKDMNGKKIRGIKDKNVCDNALVKGNIHTLTLLKYSNFLIHAKVGKAK